MADKAEEKATPMVTNISGKKVPILQYVVMPDGRAVKKFSGEILPELPHDVAGTLQCKRLADLGLLKIEGYTPPEVRTAKVKPGHKVKTKAPDKAIAKAPAKVKAPAKADPPVEDKPIRKWEKETEGSG